MARKVVTIYIDETSIRLLVAGKKGVKQWAEKPLEPGMVNDGVIVQEAEVAAAIKEFFKAEAVSARKVIAGLSGLHCLSRVITLPRLPRTLLGEAVKREAQRVIPVPLDQLYIVWQVIPGNGAELKVFLVALPRNVADALIKTLRRAGINPYLIDLKPLALARLVDKDTAIIADIQPGEVDIVVIVDKVPQVIRTMSVPAEARTRLNKLSVVEEELDRTIRFYNSSHPESPLSSDIPMLVSGELAKESTVDSHPTDLKPLATARTADKDTAIVADIQPAAVDIAIIVDKVPQLMRTLPLPTEAGLRAQRLASLEEELDRTIKFYNSSHPEKPLSPDIPVLISGEPGKEPGDEQSPTRTSELKSSAVPLSSPLKYPEGFDSNKYIINIGLALKELLPKKTPINVNVLPEVYRPKPRSILEMVFVPGATVTAALLIPLLLLVQSASAHTTALRSQLEATSRINKERQVQKKELGELKKKVDEVIVARDASQKVLTYFSQSQENINCDLSTVTSLLPDFITMTSLSHSGDRLIISGNTLDERDILAYAKALRDSKRFSQVIIASISSVKNPMVFRFTLIK